MSKFLDFLNESNFKPDVVEEFILALANSKRDFEWQTTDRDLGAAYRYGSGNFFECLYDAKNAAKTEGFDAIATVNLSGAELGRDIILMYDSKTRKWSLLKDNWN